MTRNMTIQMAWPGWARARSGSKSIGSRFGSAIIRHHAAVAAACFAFIFIVGLGLTRVTTNIDLLKLFDDKVRVRQDYAWLESNIGRLVPLEVVIEFPAEKQRSASETVDASQAARKLSYSGAARARVAHAADDRPASWAPADETWLVRRCRP